MEKLYHYTNVEGFLCIMKFKKLWLSGAHNLNDHQEISWTNNKIFNILKQLADASGSKHAQELWEVITLNKLTPYICSFSTKGDLLSQWRAYTNDGKGVAIGFRNDLLPHSQRLPMYSSVPKDSVTTLQVVYDTKVQDNTIEGIISEYLKSRKDNPNNSDSIINASFLLNGLSTAFKNEAFHEECEWRMIHTPMIMEAYETNKTTIYSGISQARHRVSSDRLITYFEFDFSNLIESGIVCDLILGPKCKMTEYDLEIFLSLNGFEKLKFRRSVATYR
ncbi:MAG: DUF2971 domain-containing protein [Proteobacteria bacterium]|nr:DUF2971 domain-containing protein [Pseudomonadota bacterium]